MATNKRDDDNKESNGFFFFFHFVFLFYFFAIHNGDRVTPFHFFRISKIQVLEMKKDQKKLNKKKEKKYYDTFYGDNEQEINSYNTVPI
jgi:hypothetical protein